MIRIVAFVGMLVISGAAANLATAGRITLTNAKHTPHAVPHCKHGKLCHTAHAPRR